MVHSPMVSVRPGDTGDTKAGPTPLLVGCPVHGSTSVDVRSGSRSGRGGFGWTGSEWTSSSEEPHGDASSRAPETKVFSITLLLGGQDPVYLPTAHRPGPTRTGSLWGLWTMSCSLRR